MLRGVDVSSHQGDIDWAKYYNSGRHYAFVKATEGLTFVDPRFTAARINAMRNARVLLGPYHFARPQPGRTGAQEAKFFIDVIRKAGWDPKRDLPPVLDIEVTKVDAQGTQAFIRLWVTTVRALTGVRPILYTFPNFWQQIGNPNDDFETLLWMANYGVTKPWQPRGWKTWSFWQYSDNSVVPGIPAPVDQNYFNGDDHDLLALAEQIRPNNTVLTDTEFKLTNELKALRAEAKIVGWKTAPRHRAEAIKNWIAAVRMPYLAKAIKQDGPAKYNRAKRYGLLKAAYGTWPTPAAKWPTDVPTWVPKKYWTYWREPWRAGAKKDKSFRKLLDQHGYLSPHFLLAEARCKCGEQIPASLNSRSRDQAFNLEVLRHKLGDKPIPIISWYRPKWYNDQIGGANLSQHINAVATDHPRAWVDTVGRAKLLAAGDIIFAKDGMGVYPSGSVHFDDRGVRARWNSWVRTVGQRLALINPEAMDLTVETAEEDELTTTIGLAVEDLYDTKEHNEVIVTDP